MRNGVMGWGAARAAQGVAGVATAGWSACCRHHGGRDVARAAQNAPTTCGLALALQAGLPGRRSFRGLVGHLAT